MATTRARVGAATLAVSCLLATGAPTAAAQDPALTGPVGLGGIPPGSWVDMVIEGLIRLPLAAALGTVLAFRPKRRGTPTRTPAVVQTQIILAVVGALIMLVVGSSLARAFGIVGAASLIRYRSKIEDPKDAGVMLCCLAVGLASGVGLYGLALVATLFLVGSLAIIESFEPKNLTHFALQATGIKDAGELRPRFEQVLRRYQAEYSLRSQAADALAYDVKVPFELQTERVTNAILQLEPDGKIAVEWDEKSKK
jgi:uncharacterized membrane protein YhiD involved in acid resistance